MSKVETQRLYDRANPEYAQAKGHNKRVKDVYPETWALSTITTDVLTDWIKDHKNKPCVYCGNKAVEVDHIHPLSKGGKHELENLQMLCLDCNRSKHDQSDEEFKAWRASNPVKPSGLKLTDYGIPYSDLKHGTTGRFRTRSLFKETHTKTKHDLPPIFTLKFEDVGSLISLQRLYLAIGDPTEYRFARYIFNDHRHWGKLCRLGWFRVHIDRWRRELRAKIRAEAVENLIVMARDNLNAMRALATEDYIYVSYLEEDPEKQKPRRVGRPNKDKFVVVPTEEELEQDAARLNLG